MRDFERPSPNSARTTRAYGQKPDELARAIESAVEKLPSWTLEGSQDGTIHAVRRTRIFRFKDDVTVRISERDAGSEATFESASRVGKGDLGQNPRNLQQLLEAVNEELTGGQDAG